MKSRISAGEIMHSGRRFGNSISLIWLLTELRARSVVQLLPFPLSDIDTSLFFVTA